MYIKKCEKSEVKQHKIDGFGVNQRLIMDFYESDLDVAEIVDIGDRNLLSLRGNLDRAAKSLGIFSVHVLKRGNRLFLMRESN